MQTQDVSTRRVTTKPSRHEVMNKNGFEVVVWLNGQRTVSFFYDNKKLAQARAATLRSRLIPKGAKLGLVGGKWLPLTSCDSLFKL